MAYTAYPNNIKPDAPPNTSSPYPEGSEYASLYGKQETIHIKRCLSKTIKK